MRGPLLMAGGGHLPDSVVGEFVALCGGAGKARIAVIPFASERAEAGDEAVSMFVSAGAEASTASSAEGLAGASGIWMTGGDQNVLVRELRRRGMAAPIKKRHDAGAAVGGTSAGASAMSRLMIAGDGRDGMPEVGRGLGLLPYAVIDQHFTARGRQDRLVRLIAKYPQLIGAGIDESTALVVEPGGAWRVVGDGAVILYENSDAPGPLMRELRADAAVWPASGAFGAGKPDP